MIEGSGSGAVPLTQDPDPDAGGSKKIRIRIRNTAYNTSLMCCLCAPGQYLGCGDVLPAEPLANDAALLHLEAPASALPPPASALPTLASDPEPALSAPAADPEPECRQVPVLEQ